LRNIYGGNQMKFSWKALTCCTLALIAGSIGLGVQAKGSPMEESCSSFVQGFYSWYIKPSGKPPKEHTDQEVLKAKSSSFDAELRRQLKVDYDASAKVSGEIVGLDMDPFLATNAEPYEHYSIGKITEKNGAYLVEVYGTTKGKKTDKPVVTPELKFKDKHWEFTNFHYGKSEFPENENLLSILKCLRESRAKDAAAAKDTKSTKPAK